MTTLLATLAYDGREFAGWQRQAGQRTVQGCVEEALLGIAGQPVAVRAAGRTDAGVHARGQRISFDFAKPIPPDKLLLALNARLPADAAVSEVVEVAAGFDIKRDSLAKRYVYRILLSPDRPVFERGVVWHRRGRLDLEAMRQAASQLVGEHDFESFRNAGCQARHAVRAVWKVEVRDVGPHLSIEVRGNAFVRGMVRIISGTLYEVGRGRRAADSMPTLLAARDRDQAGITAPAQGLTLEQVYLPDQVELAEVPDWASWPGFRQPS